MFAAAARPIFSSFARASARRFAWVNPKQASTAADAASQSGGGGGGLAVALGLLGFAGGGALAYYQFSDGTLRLVAPIADGSKNIAADFEAKLAPNGPFAGLLDTYAFPAVSPAAPSCTFRLLTVLYSLRQYLTNIYKQDWPHADD
jgi:hypothetical protein